MTKLIEKYEAEPHWVKGKVLVPGQSVVLSVTLGVFLGVIYKINQILLADNSNIKFYIHSNITALICMLIMCH